MISSADEFNALMSDLGRLDDGIQEVIRDESGSWVVRIDEVDVLVEHDIPGRAIRLGTEVGVPPGPDRLALFETLLIYNSAARETGDVVMALSGPGGSVMQTLVLPLAGATAQSLVTPVVNLAERALVWRALLAGGAPEADAADDIASTMNFIRV